MSEAAENTERPRPGAVRPGGRTARTRTAVLTAAFKELDAHGLPTLTLDTLAQRSGVHVTTIRRRWRTVAGVLVDLLAEQSTTIPVPDAGSLRADLRQLARAIGDFHGASRNSGLIEGIVAEASRDMGMAEVLHEAFTARTAHVAQIVDRAVERGELSAHVNATALIAALSAPFYYRLLIIRRPVDDALVRTSAEAAYAAALAGVFTRAPGASEPARDVLDAPLP